MHDVNQDAKAPSTRWYRRKIGTLGKLGVGLCFVGSVIVPSVDTPWWPVLMIVVWSIGVLLWLTDIRRSG